MKNLILTTALLSLTSFSAMAQTKTLLCDETQSHHGSRERFILKFDEQKQLISVDDKNWNEKTNSWNGGDTYSYSDSKPLKPVVRNGAVVYKYISPGDPGDGDFPVPDSIVTITLQSNDMGNATIVAKRKNNDDADTFVLNCK
jgi:hypothetical protein